MEYSLRSLEHSAAVLRYNGATFVSESAILEVAVGVVDGADDHALWMQSSCRPIKSV